MLAALLALAGGCEARDTMPEAAKPRLVLMTALPIVWGEGDIGETLSGARRPAEAYRWLAERYEVVAVDTLDGALDGETRLLLAHPRALTGAELVALDAWVRGGGRALILADPQLDWHGRYPPGDPRAPPPMTLLDPLLTHWGLRLDLPARLIRERGGCAIEPDGMLARCALGRGRAVVAADADLLDDAHWRDGRPRFEAWMTLALASG